MVETLYQYHASVMEPLLIVGALEPNEMTIKKGWNVVTKLSVSAWLLASGAGSIAKVSCMPPSGSMWCPELQVSWLPD